MSAWRASDVLVRRRPLLWPFLAGAALALALPLAAEIYVLAALVGLVELLLLFFLPAILYDDSLRGARWMPAVQADREGLRFGQKLVLPRKRIEACALEPLSDGTCTVHLWGPGRRDDISLSFHDAERARHFIDALGLRSDVHAARFLVESAPLRTPGVARLVRGAIYLGASLVILGVFLLTLRSEWVGFTLVPLLFAYFALVRRLRRRRTVTLGADALTVKTAIPLSEIRTVTAVSGKGMDARVDDMVLRFDGRDAREKRDAFVERLHKSLEARVPLPASALLEPGARDRRAWLEDLRRLGGDGYRSGGVPTEELWRLVEQPAASPGARVGALAMLASRLDGQGRLRIAELAEATVKPEVRAALEAASGEDATDEVILEAFEK